MDTKAYFVRVDVYVFAKTEAEAVKAVEDHLAKIPAPVSEALVVDSGEVNS